jgi:tRNA-dihydrouridine synthase B
MAFSWSKVPRPIVALAPMAGYTDSAFRQIVKSIVPEIICFSELISSNAIRFNNERTMKMLDFEEKEYPLIMQLFGKDPKFFVEAGKKLESLGIAGIDINMGCPARKVIHAEQGSALLKNPDLAAEIVHQLSKNIKIPVSVKTRMGFEKYDPEKMISFLKKLESAGAKLITLHGRTTKQGFSGEADWNPIYLAKKELKIPVIGNGDISSVEVAKNRLKDLDGIMIGRATYGNPWIMAEIHAALHDSSFTPPETIHEKLPIIKKHLDLNITQKGEKYGLLEMRKHLGFYLRGFIGAKELRQKIVTENDVEKVYELLDL